MELILCAFEGTRVRIQSFRSTAGGVARKSQRVVESDSVWDGPAYMTTSPHRGRSGPISQSDLRAINVGVLEPFRKHELLAVLVLLALGVALRFWMLGRAAFGTDSMEFYKLALRNQSIIEFWRNPPWMNQIPLNEILSLLMIKVGLPATPLVVRLPFAVMGVLALLAVWWFARRWFGSGPALATLLLAAFNPYQIYFSRTAYHYSGAICWSAAMFLAFWHTREALHRHERPPLKFLSFWVVTAILACHMHMSVWPVAAIQGVVLLGSSCLNLRSDKTLRMRWCLHLVGAFLVLGLFMIRWVLRALNMVQGVASGTQKFLGHDLGSELLRLFPAYFAGENVYAVAALVVCFALAVCALFGDANGGRRYRSLAWVCLYHIALMILYVVIVGGGVAKITYFSAIWLQFMLFLGVGSWLAVQKVVAAKWRGMAYACLAAGYLALTAWPAWAIVHLDGNPAAFYRINNWILKNLPAGTPILTDRWFHPWNELAVHNPGNINYTFTVPDEPLESYQRFNWRATAEGFFEKYPDAALLEVARGRYEVELGRWAFPEKYFAHVAAITNDAAMTLRRLKCDPASFYEANSNGVVTRIFYNTTEDLVAAARRKGGDVLRLYGAGWGYAKPGWPQGHFEDYRIAGQSAVLDVYNLRDTPLRGTLEIAAAAAGEPKTVAINGERTIFEPNRIRTWNVPMTLQPGRNAVVFGSPSRALLFVLDVRWRIP